MFAGFLPCIPRKLPVHHLKNSVDVLIPASRTCLLDSSKESMGGGALSIVTVYDEVLNRILYRSPLVRSWDPFLDFRSVLADQRPRLTEEVCIQRLEAVTEAVLKFQGEFLQIDRVAAGIGNDQQS